MKRSVVFHLIVIIAAVSTFSVTQISAFEIVTAEDFKQNIITKDILIRTADNFIVLYDASGSMGDDYKEGVKKIDAQFQILEQQNEILPELGYKAGLYTFTPFKTYYEMKTYIKVDFRYAIDRLPNTKTGGFVGQPTPLAEGIKALDPILANLSGKNRHILIQRWHLSTRRTEAAAAGHGQKSCRKIQCQFLSYQFGDNTQSRKTAG